MLEGGMGSYMPRFGLMHYLACFTLFDGDPHRVNTILDGFLAVTPEQVQAVAQKYLVPRNRAVLVATPRESRRCAMTTPATSDLLASSRPALGPERPVVWPKRTIRMLPNGLQVVLVESHTFPKISAPALFPQRQRRRRALRARPRRNDGHRRAHRHRDAPQPPHRRGFAPHGRRPRHHAGADSSAISASRPRGIFRPACSN